jgi:hypothetical protein
MGNPACVQICIPRALNWIEMSEEKQKVILYNKMEMIQTFNDAG